MSNFMCLRIKKPIHSMVAVNFILNRKNPLTSTVMRIVEFTNPKYAEIRAGIPRKNTIFTMLVVIMYISCKNNELHTIFPIVSAFVVLIGFTHQIWSRARRLLTNLKEIDRYGFLTVENVVEIVLVYVSAVFMYSVGATLLRERGRITVLSTSVVALVRLISDVDGVLMLSLRDSWDRFICMASVTLVIISGYIARFFFGSRGYVWALRLVPIAHIIGALILVFASAIHSDYPRRRKGVNIPSALLSALLFVLIIYSLSNSERYGLKNPEILRLDKRLKAKNERISSLEDAKKQAGDLITTIKRLRERKEIMERERGTVSLESSSAIERGILETRANLASQEQKLNDISRRFNGLEDARAENLLAKMNEMQEETRLQTEEIRKETFEYMKDMFSWRRSLQSETLRS